MGQDQPKIDLDNAQAGMVAQVTTTLLSAVNESDLPGVVAVWSHDGVLMPPHHPSVHGRRGIERYFSRLFRRSRLKFSFTASRIEVFGDIAFERRVLRVGVAHRGRTGSAG